MPPPRKPTRPPDPPDPPAENHDLYAAFAYEALPPSPWRRSEKGNLRRHWLNLWLTVFERPAGGGWYAWSVARGKEVMYSPWVYRTERAAVAAVWDLVQDL